MQENESNHAAISFISLLLDGQDAVSVSMIAINTAGRLLYCNRNGQALLKSARVLHLRNGVLSCADAARRKEFAAAIALTIDTGQPAHLLLSDRMQVDQRHSVSLSRFLKPDTRSIAGEHEGVLCLVAPLDHRRTATVHQLMQLFGLSAAEARLARALASGETLEAYARENALKIPTVKTQLQATFAKTGTDRQAALVRLIMGIPAVRDIG